MENKRHYSGLTDQQVVQNRINFGQNILTPVEKEGFLEKIKEACSHWIFILISLIFLFSIVANFVFDIPKFGITPCVLGLSTLLILIVGIFGAFKDSLLKILIIAFILSIGISIYQYIKTDESLAVFLEPIGIIFALILATSVAFFLERNNEKTFKSLNQVNDDTLVKTYRNNNVCQIARKDLVVDDIIILEAGEEIPADCLLLESLNLVVNESSLTGELQTEKSTQESKFDKDATYPSNHILKGTIILEGYCTAKVISVGDKTECGKVFEAAQVNQGEDTPLSQKLDKLADLITKTSYIFAILIFVGRLLTFFFVQNHSLGSSQQYIEFVSYLLNTLMIAVTLIVVAVPEGLPMSVTLSLAFSMQKLMKENTLPRTMHACETMGAISVICTDKTGTLTQNKMQVAHTKLEEKNLDLIGEMISTNSTADLDFSNPQDIKAIGNPTESALLLWLNNQKINYSQIRENTQIINRLPFSTENKYMATIVNSKVLNKKVLYLKGAPEIIMDFCSMTSDLQNSYETHLKDYQNKAMRTLAFAYQEIEDDFNPISSGQIDCDNLKFVGIFAISDPIRKEVPMAIKSCIDAGIKVKIVTGDTPNTAKEIGRQIGLWQEDDKEEKNLMLGNDFAQKTDQELLEMVTDIKILSRARPNDKERLVKLLKQKSMVVAATGDGTNDAPALNVADVGLSMGDGTAVAKEASDMTILDNSFSTIKNAVLWGRSLYKNIQRFIMFQMTINVAACLIVLIGAFLGTESPLTVTQMLWVNLIMDTFAAIALASLPPSSKVMEEKPRKITDNIISKAMAKNILGIGFLFTILLIGILLIMQHSDIKCVMDLFNFSYGQYNGLSEYELSIFFNIFIYLQFWNMFNAKAFMTNESAFSKLKNCKGFVSIAIVILIGQILITELGGKMFNVCHLKTIDFILIISITSLVLFTKEIFRFFRK